MNLRNDDKYLSSYVNDMMDRQISVQLFSLFLIWDIITFIRKRFNTFWNVSASDWNEYWSCDKLTPLLQIMSRF